MQHKGVQPFTDAATALFKRVESRGNTPTLLFAVPPGAHAVKPDWPLSPDFALSGLPRLTSLEDSMLIPYGGPVVASAGTGGTEELNMEVVLNPAPAVERVAECIAEVLHHPLHTMST